MWPPIKISYIIRAISNCGNNASGLIISGDDYGEDSGCGSSTIDKFDSPPTGQSYQEY